MNLSMDELRRLDPKDVGNWPAIVQLVVLFLILVIVVVAGYFAVLDSQRSELAADEQKESQLKEAYLDKKAKAINLEAYEEQLNDIQQAFGALLKQLPGKAEMETLITEINQSGVGRGLKFIDFKPAPTETKTSEFAERPISLKVVGSYHDLAAFASDVAQLPRIVTLSNLHLTSTIPEGGNKALVVTQMTLEATAKTYRALDSEESVAQKKGAKKPE
jgi:type IV pilus assembly protein PilO